MKNSTTVTKTKQPVAHKAAPSRWRSRLKRIALISFLVCFILALLLSGGAFWFVQRTLPQVSGTLTVTGLEQTVSVRRDQWGVPYIKASTLHDVLFAQGYVTAQDRLFQMEFNRLLAQGRLAEFLGAGNDNEYVNADAFIRTLGLYHAARVQLNSVDTRSKQELQAYADGVNAFLHAHNSSLPLELTFLGITPEDWTPVDSLAYGGELALSLDQNWYFKYTRALMLEKASLATVNAFFPAYPQESPTLITATGQAAPLTLSSFASATSLPFQNSDPSARILQAAPSYSHLSPDLLQGAIATHTLLGSMSDSLGSNNWVIDGTKTASGKPLLANDPHLHIDMPSTWYEVALQGGGLNVIGFSIPGAPGIIIGHNDHIAWGLTDVGADNTDLFLETLDSSDSPQRYRYNQQWLPLQIHQETLQVHGAAKPTIITVRATAHGPLLNTVTDDLKHYQPVALAWTFLQPGYSFAGFFQLDFAANWSEFQEALAHISASQNFVYADTQGNIGYRMSGLLPIRPAENDLLPVDGSTSLYDWRGYVPQEKMPVLFNPPTHIIATANNQIVPDNAPVYVTSSATWDPGYRAQRINDLLLRGSQFTIEDFKQMQADVYCIPAAILTPYFISAGLTAGGDASKVARLLQGWDYTMTTKSTAAALFEVVAGNIIREVSEQVLGKALYSLYKSNYFSSALFSVLIRLIKKPTAPFFGLTDNQQNSAARDRAIVQAMNDAFKALTARLGSDTSQWSWGKLHQAHFQHPFASIPGLGLAFDTAPVERPGDGATISIGGDGRFTSDPPTYEQRAVSSMREIIDLSDFDSSLWTITVGESGQPFSRHYSDLLPLWNQGLYQVMTFTAKNIEKATVDLLTLQPGSS